MNKLAGFVGVLALVAAAPLARADFSISVNGTVCNSSVSASPNGNLTCASVTPVAGVTITDLALTGTQTAGFSQQLGTTLLITNTSGVSQTITIDIADTNFSSPTTPPSISDHSGATLDNTTATNSYQLSSCVNQANTVVFCTTPAPGEAPPNATLTLTGANTTSNESTGTITSLSADFALVQQLTITAAAGSDFNVTSSQILTPVPEPASVLLMGGMLVGISGMLRKKLAKRS
jgi:hypothetical protein